MSAGQFTGGELEGFELFSVNVGYRFLSWLGGDVQVGRVFGSEASGDFLGANLYLEPAAHWKLSPFLALGLGEITLGSQPKQISFTQESSDFNSYGIGASFYLGRNFIVKSEYRWYSVSTEDETERLEAWNIGFNTFF